MSHQKFDSKTTKKLLTNYQNTISKYASENEQLTRQLEDLKTTLTLNQNLLYDFIKSSVGEDESITSLINESKQLWAENESLRINRRHPDTNSGRNKFNQRSE